MRKTTKLIQRAKERSCEFRGLREEILTELTMDGLSFDDLARVLGLESFESKIILRANLTHLRQIQLLKEDRKINYFGAPDPETHQSWIPGKDDAARARAVRKSASKSFAHARGLGYFDPDPCEVTGCDAQGTRAYHPDPRRPFDVLWYCTKHALQLTACVRWGRKPPWPTHAQ